MLFMWDSLPSFFPPFLNRRFVRSFGLNLSQATPF